MLRPFLLSVLGLFVVLLTVSFYFQSIDSYLHAKPAYSVLVKEGEVIDFSDKEVGDGNVLVVFRAIVGSEKLRVSKIPFFRAVLPEVGGSVRIKLLINGIEKVIEREVSTNLIGRMRAKFSLLANSQVEMSFPVATLSKGENITQVEVKVDTKVGWFNNLKVEIYNKPGLL